VTHRVFKYLNVVLAAALLWSAGIGTNARLLRGVSDAPLSQGTSEQEETRQSKQEQDPAGDVLFVLAAPTLRRGVLREPTRHWDVFRASVKTPAPRRLEIQVTTDPRRVMLPRRTAPPDPEQHA